MKMSEMNNDQQFLEFVVKSIVDHPEAVTCERQIDDMGVLLRLRVHAEDMGQVVGRQGATAKAIRSLLRIVGIKNNARVNLKIEEPEGSTHMQNRQASATPTSPAMGEVTPTPATEPVEEDPIADELAL